MVWRIVEPWRRSRVNKLGARKVVVDGIKFDSQREANRYFELRCLERAGKIQKLERQVKYELIPAAFEDKPTGEIYRKGPMKGQPKIKRVCVERGVDYVADFRYIENGLTVVEDAKGYRDPESAVYKVFVIKRKLMLHLHGIKVKEV
jgi:hypothetical protein